MTDSDIMAYSSVTADANSDLKEPAFGSGGAIMAALESINSSSTAQSGSTEQYNEPVEAPKPALVNKEPIR